MHINIWTCIKKALPICYLLFHVNSLLNKYQWKFAATFEKPIRQFTSLCAVTGTFYVGYLFLYGADKIQYGCYKQNWSSRRILCKKSCEQCYGPVCANICWMLFRMNQIRMITATYVRELSRFSFGSQCNNLAWWTVARKTAKNHKTVKIGGWALAEDSMVAVSKIKAYT